MISKVLKAQSGSRPTGQAGNGQAGSKGGAVYDNKGSSARLTDYMEHEAKKQGQTGQYFSRDADGIGKQEVTGRIDGNVKGLKKEDSKFYSLIVSPSEPELKHIGSDAGKLKQYTRQVMENYAANFKLAGGRTLESKDLVWYAVVHRERQYSGTDTQVREGRARSGERKQGDQTHIHIIVSRRDAGQKTSLTPTGAKSRFPAQDWQQKNARDFQRMYGYAGESHFSRDAHKEAKLRGRVEAFSRQHNLQGYLSVDRVVLTGKEQGFGRGFYRNLKTMETTLEKGIRPTDPYSGLSRKDLYKAYATQREYRTDSKAERALNRQVVGLRSAYLKEYGVALTELEMSSRAIREAYGQHGHKWKFHRNFSELKDTILQSGHLPADYRQRLERKATEGEIAAGRESYRAGKGYPATPPAGRAGADGRAGSGKEYADERAGNQQTKGGAEGRAGERGGKPSGNEKATGLKQIAAEDSLDRQGDKSIDRPGGGSTGSGSKVAAGLSMLQNFLEGMDGGPAGVREAEWSERPRKKPRYKEQNNREYSL